jgi:spore maturation protein CgeB
LQFVDYPLTHAERLDQFARSAALLTVDETHVDAITSIYGAQHFAYVGFSPHAAIGEPAPRAKDAAAFAAQRPISILFAGTFYRDGETPWQSLDAPVRKVFDDALDIAASSEFIPALEAFDQAMAASGLDPADKRFTDLRKGARLVHEQMRRRRRFLLLKGAAKIGLPMHVFGSGYERQLYRFKNVSFGGSASYTEILHLMQQSRLVLNANANFGAGSHERPLSALLAGAAAVSDHSTFYERAFRDGEEICLFKWQDLDAGLAKIAALADSPEAAWGMARAGQRRVLAEHRWSNRIDNILGAAAAAREQAMAIVA